MNKTLITLIGLTTIANSSFAKDDNTSRDAFVRDIVISLIENKASHVDTAQHVETAYAAWQRYQDLISQDSNKIIPKDLDKSIEIAEE
jgi:hypothetical protein